MGNLKKVESGPSNFTKKCPFSLKMFNFKIFPIAYCHKYPIYNFLRVASPISRLPIQPLLSMLLGIIIYLVLRKIFPLPLDTQVRVCIRG